uniref:hypothetical protein n=1 Tax=Eubacterium cellulosolvens TaxID=29322 RepID=UPI000482A113|nr:hypothetical protein [[Eubacterium] cellulosolvens]
METNAKKGKLCLRTASGLYVLFWFLLIVFGLFGNPASRYVLALFDGNANYYMSTLLVLLFGILIAGMFLSRRAKTYTNGSTASKAAVIVYLVTFILAIVAIVLFIFFILLMVASGSLL